MGSLGLTCDQVKINFPVGIMLRDELTQLTSHKKS
jgi:hypothetical protein